MISRNNRLTCVLGNNFSGRSKYFRQLKSEAAGKGNIPFINIGEIPANYITGLAPDVEQELHLHSTWASGQTKTRGTELLDSLGFGKHYHKSPFDLSGGEQTVLSVVSSLLAEPEILTVDTTLEQLHEKWRNAILDTITAGDFPLTRCYLSDNRMSDYGLEEHLNVRTTGETVDYKYIFGTLNSDFEIPNTQEPVTIGLNGLSFGYETNKVFSDFSFFLEPGSIYRLNGANGTGKSTISKILSGLLKVEAGMLMVNGQNYHAYKNPGQIVGYSFQNPDEQLFKHSVENEVLPRAKKGTMDYQERRELFLEMFGLNSVRQCHPAELPFSMRKRVALAATLAVERPWYVLDEPTLGQDDNFLESFSIIMRKMASSGKGMVFISHAEKFGRNNSEKEILLH